MPQKKKRKLQLSDFIIILICLSVCAASLLFFWKDLNTSSTRDDISNIARISDKKNILQRKFADRVVWERLQQNSLLYDSDTIRTSDDADARIEFINNTVIEISENTMIQVSLDSDGSVNVAVGGGNISVDTTASSEKSSVKLSMQDGSVVKLDSGSKVTASSYPYAYSDGTEGSASSISVQAGSAVVSNANGDSQALNGGESVCIEEDGVIRKQDITITSVSKNLRVFKIDEKTEPLKLEWQASQELEENPVEIKVQVSRDKDFTQIVESYSATGSSSVDIQPTEEKLYWRVFTEDEEEKAVEGRIQVIDIENTELSYPINNSLFKYRKNYPVINFAWSESEYADYYRIEISSTEDFSQPVIVQDIAQNNFTTAKLGKGNYFWRVTPYYSVNLLGFTGASETYNLFIEEKDKNTPPQLMVPANNSKITLGDSEQNIMFAWKSDVKPALYKVLISADEDFENSEYEWLTDQLSSVQSFNITTMPEGSYFWKIIRTSDDDDGEINSDCGKFNVVKYVPGENRLIYPPDNYSVEKDYLAKLSFNWKIANEYKDSFISTIVQVSRDAEFTQIEHEYETEELQLTNLSLPRGKYFWRVGVKTAEGVTGYSAARTFSILDELQKVKFISPLASSKNVIGENENVLISWSKVENADYYKCLVTDADGKTVYKSDRLTSTSVRISLKSSADTTKYTSYKASVTPYRDESDYISGGAGPAEILSFEIRKPDPIKLVSPVNNVSFDGLQALRTPIRLTYKTGDTPVRKTLILQKQNANGTWKTIETLTNPSETVELTRLGEGRYQWTVTASNSNGQILNAPGYGTFVVQSIPLLKPAVLVNPEPEKIIDSKYLRKNRNITFNWEKVEGATEYEFDLYLVGRDGSYKNIYSANHLKSTSVKIKDLSIFDLGTFEWHVHAYSVAKDGFVEQKGQQSSARFKIQFELPKKVQTKDPGTMYGD